MNADFSERLIVEADLSRALSRDELEVFYQPKVDLRTKRVVGFEALVRWRHGVRGLMTPESFIPVAGASALIADIGRFVVATVCAQCAAWQKVGMRAVPVGVNISARELQDSNVVSMVRTVLEMTELEPELLEIEVTESAA